MKQPNQIQGYKVDKSTIINLERGKIPPQALDLEEVVLGVVAATACCVGITSPGAGASVTVVSEVVAGIWD